MFVKTSVGRVGALEGNVKAGSYVFSKMDDPFKEYFQRLKALQFWGSCPIFF